METRIYGRDVDVSESLERYVGRKFERLAKRLPQVMTATAEIKQNSSRAPRHRYVVQMTLTAPGQTLRAQQRAPSVSEAVDAASDVMDRQIRRYKGRRYRSNQQRVSIRDLPDAMSEAAEEEEEADAIEFEDMPIRVVRRKRFPMVSMSVDDAIAEMELLHHSFYLFRRVDTGTYNVVYQRSDGDYGLIEPVEG